VIRHDGVGGEQNQNNSTAAAPKVAEPTGTKDGAEDKAHYGEADDFADAPAAATSAATGATA
jgi:hypothetical protein